MKRKIFLFFLAAVYGLSGQSSAGMVYAAEEVMESDHAVVAEQRIARPTLDQGIPGVEEADVVYQEEIEEQLAAYLAGEEASVTSIRSSELHSPQYWSLDAENGRITVAFHDDHAEDGIKTMVSVHSISGNIMEKPYCQEWGSMENCGCEVKLDVSFLPDGTYKLMLWQGIALDNRVSSLMHYNIEVAAGEVSFVNPAFADHNQAFMASLNANYDPNDHNQVPYKYYPYTNTWYSAYNLDEMTAKARELTEDCFTDEEKVQVIHDWVCENFAYDFEALYKGEIDDQADAAWTFANKRGVCSGFARMCQIMLTSVGVPCMNVIGYSEGSTDGLVPEDAGKSNNHEWNVVYLDGSWRSIDVTWDCQNSYLGEFSGKVDAWGTPYGETTTGNAPCYIYYGMTPFNMGGTHISLEVYMDAIQDAYVTDLKIDKEPSKKSFLPGEPFVCDAIMKYTLSNGDQYPLVIKGKEAICCSGYDMTQEGVWTVTISYCGQSETYDILVTAKPHEHTPGDWQVVTEPTCGTEGEKQIRCTDCNAVLQKESIPVTGEHSIGDWVVVRQATKQREGIRQRECTVCHEVLETEVIPVILSGESSSDTTGQSGDETGNISSGKETDENQDSSDSEKADGGNQSDTDDSSGTTGKSEDETGNTSSEQTTKTDDETGADTDTKAAGGSQPETENPSGTATGTGEKTDSEAEGKTEHGSSSEAEGKAEDGSGSEAEGKTEDGSGSGAEGKTEGGSDPAADGKTEDGSSPVTEDLSATATQSDASQTAGTVTKTDQGSQSDVQSPSAVVTNPDTKEAQPDSSKQSQTSGSTTTGTQDKAADDSGQEIEVGDAYAVGKYMYEVTSVSDQKRTVTCMGFDEDFVNIKKITSAIVPSKIWLDAKSYTVTAVGGKAFYKCTALKKVTLPGSITAIGRDAFYGCTKLSGITIPANVTAVEAKAFYGCMKLVKITIPANVTVIGSKAFYGCKKLTTVSIKSKKLTAAKVGSQAFKGIARKAVIKVPKSKLTDYKKFLKKKGVPSKATIKKG